MIDRSLALAPGGSLCPDKFPFIIYLKTPGPLPQTQQEHGTGTWNSEIEWKGEATSKNGQKEVEGYKTPRWVPPLL